ncbi:MAG: hypothetical protein AB1831_06345 [Pseudomonadota bacterium]
MTTSKWNAQPGNGEWNAPANWHPAGVPTGTAAFAASARTAITFAATGEATVGHIEFTDDAPAYTFTFGPSATPALTITGKGVSNRSGRQQSFIVAATSSGYKSPQLRFTDSASAGGDDLFYCAGPETAQGYGGGVISFCGNSTAGSASFKAWTGAARPPEHNTVGGEIAFSDTASAGSARFTIHGSLGADGDTFGNVVFHDDATAANAAFTNIGGTVAGGDGGNTQFYGNSTAAGAVFDNRGGTHAQANGGDVAFDATANGGHAHFYNHAAQAAGAYGGVTSFNNNPPEVTEQGASAGHGSYFNYGARAGERGGGGHVEFSAKYGSPSAADAHIVNYGSTIADKSSAGHTIFSISLPTRYFPSAGEATIWNHPGVGGEGAAGFTEFSVYGAGSAGSNVPSAGDATIINLGGHASRAAGGYTVFSGAASAGNATLIAYGGSQGGHGGRVVFYDTSSGGTAKVHLFGNGELDIADHKGGVGIGALELTGGVIAIQLGGSATRLSVSGELTLKSSRATFSFRAQAGGGFAFDTPYTILSGAGLAGFTAAQFEGNAIEGVAPSFAIVGNDLQVTFARA